MSRRRAERFDCWLGRGGDYHEYLRRNGWIDGFVTTKGNFVDRHAGIQIAKSQRQLQKEPATYHDNCADGLDSSDLILSTH